jgi:hypothetical protein
MASQLEGPVDLYQDTKQALNVYFEAASFGGVGGGGGLNDPYSNHNNNSNNRYVEMKDACTQTISSKLTNQLSHLFVLN